MFIESVQRLGADIREALRQAQRNSETLPEIAASHLDAAELSFDFDLNYLAEHLLTTTVEPPALNFNDLPLVLYRCEDFYIEFLVWTNATTKIHQHAFSGAFRVMVGSSFHSQWRFEERTRINQDMLIGECECISAEILRVGDIQPIKSGRSGLLHALFHLDQPSATLVVRTYAEPWAQPQYGLEPPHLAVDTAKLSSDFQVTLLSRTLNVAAQLGTDSPVRLVEEWCSRLDFPRLYQIIRTNEARLRSEWDRILDAVSAAHGEKADYLNSAVQRARRDQLITATRKSVTDPEIRLFLAMLLNAPDRGWLLRLVKNYLPDRDPIDFCVQALIGLKGAESASEAFMEMVAKARAGRDRMGSRLAKALDGMDSQQILQAAVSGESREDLTEGLANLRSLSEFDPLFT